MWPLACGRHYLFTLSLCSMTPTQQNVFFRAYGQCLLRCQLMSFLAAFRHVTGLTPTPLNHNAEPPFLSPSLTYPVVLLHRGKGTTHCSLSAPSSVAVPVSPKVKPSRRPDGTASTRCSTAAYIRTNHHNSIKSSWCKYLHKRLRLCIKWQLAAGKASWGK